MLLMAFAFLSCNKKVASYNPDFVGHWRTDYIEDTVINATVRSEIIFDERDGIYNNTCKDECSDQLCNCSSTQSGRAVLSVDKKSIRIGSTTSLVLSVDKEPYQGADGQWFMKLGGLVYHKL